MKELKTIVIVDDDSNFLEIVKTIVLQTFSSLSEAEIHTFNDPVRAMSYIKNQPRNSTSLLVTDINMKFPGDLLGRTLTFFHPEMEVLYYSSGERPHSFTAQQTFLSKTDLFESLNEYLVSHFTLPAPSQSQS
jgi:hypothetical protein